MNKKTIAIAMGGYSQEHDVSLRSAEVVRQLLDPERFRAIKVHIQAQRWEAHYEDQLYPMDLNDFSFHTAQEHIHFDAVFNAVHGKPGEDGPLAGYLEIVGLPHTSSGYFESALTFNKAECNIILQRYGIRCPRHIFINGSDAADAREIAETLGFPCFVKPSRSGSSIGISKVKNIDEIAGALEKAAQVDRKILVEAMVKGTEVGCGVTNHNGKPEALSLTDIVPQNDFFDFESKYSGLSEEITPARIDPQISEEIMRQSEFIYEKLGLNGLVRLDFIVDEQQQAYLIEVNTVPGFSAESILPKQARHAGYELSELFNKTVEKALKSAP